jgi:hypothetical protein
MILSLLLQLAVSIPDTSVRPVVPPPPAVGVDAQQDTTPRRRARAIEVGEWYHRRLVVHKALSYAMLPVFAAQYIAGNELYDEDQGKGPAPGWARPVHQVGAASVAGIFGVNTVTGLWNLWDSRHVEDHRWLRVTHSLVMLGADAAFAYTGIKLSSEAANNGAARRQHRQVALYAIGVSVGSGVAMKIFNSR